MTRTRRLLATLTVLGLLAGTALWSGPARAQKQPAPPIGIEGPAAEEQTFEGLSIPKDREATAIIAAARDYVSKKDWDTVARSLQYLLEKPEDSFFEVTRKDENGKDYTARISIRIEANRLIGALPPEGLEVYRQKYGQRAMLMLQEGKEKNDPAILSQVALKYRHTEAGTQATQLLGNYFLDRGNYQLASGKFQELLEMLEKEKPEVRKQLAPWTFFKAALAYQRFGDGQMAQKLWKQVVELAGDKGVQAGANGQTFTLEQLRKELDRNAAVGAKTLKGWPLVGGDASRTAQGVGGPPFLEPRWSLSMFVPDPVKPEDDKEERDRKQTWQKTADWVQDKVRTATDLIQRAPTKRPILPGFFPIAGNNRVIFRTFDGVYSFIIRDDPAQGKKAGELDWAQACDGALHQMGSESGNRTTVEQWWQPYTGSSNPYTGMPNPAMPEVLFANSAVGTLSHDNKYVFFVDDLALPPHPNLGMQYYGNANPYGSFTDRVVCNTLKAVEMETGLLKWEVGERKAGSKVPVFNPGGAFRRAVVGPDGKQKIVQVNPDGTEVEIDPKTGQPIKKPEAPAKPFVPPKKEFADDRGFVNAADELMDCYFLGPPLPIGGKIYVLVEHNGEVQLGCINPYRMGPSKASKTQKEGPELVWRQPLGTANQKLLQDALRRTQPCHLAYNDGILVCPTNTGAIVAVNLLTQSLAWAYSYRTGRPDGADGPGQPGMMGGARIIRRGGRFPGDGGMSLQLAQDRWHAAPPAIANGAVVFTAPDSNDVVCLSLRDGKRLWAVKRQPGDLYMAGVYNNKVLVVGKDSVRALKLSDGSPAWDRPRPIGTPSGQGVASNGKYYVPCRSGADSPEPQIVEVDVDTGATHATKSRRKEVPGNLIFFDGEVISQSIWSVAAYPQLHVKLAEMKARLARNPNDPAGLTDLGELHLDKGELAEAVAELKKALGFRPDPDTRAKARLKLYEALTELLQKDFARGEPDLDLYKELCLNEVTGEEKLKRQSAFLCLLGKGRESQGKLVEAFDAYMEFGQLNDNRELVPSVDEPGTQARPDVWARGRILAMIAKSRPEDRRPLEQRVAREWQQVKAGGDLEKIKGFERVFGSMFRAGLEARLLLAERLAASSSPEDLRLAELKFDMVRRQRDDVGLAARATLAQAEFMARRNELKAAALLYRSLGSDFKDVKLPDGRTGADVYNELVTDKRFLPHLVETGAPLWNAGRLRGERVNGPFNQVVQAHFGLDVDGDPAPFFRRHRLVVDTQTTAGNGQWQLRLVERATGERKPPLASLRPNPYLFQSSGAPNMPLTGGARVAQARGHLLMVSWAYKVYAWDVTSPSPKPLWEYNLLDKNVEMPENGFHTDADGTSWLAYPDGSRVRVGQMGLLESSYACLSTRDGLVALDPATGAVLWRRDAGAGARLFGDAEYVFAVETGPDGAPSRTQVVRAADGVAVKVSDFGKLFHPSRRVAIVGRHLLVFDDDPAGGKALRLHDVLTGKDLWRQTYPAGSKAARAHQGDLAGVVQPDGTLTLVSAADGRVLLKADDPDERVQAEHLQNVQDLVLLQDADYFYLALNKAPNPAVFAMPFVSNGLKSMRVHGTLYSYNKGSRQLEWYRPDLDNTYLLLENFDELPIVIVGQMTNRNRGQSDAKVEAIEKRTGKLLTGEELKLTPNGGQFYALHTDPKAGVIELVRYDLKVRFRPESEIKAGAASGEKPADSPPPAGPLGGLPAAPAQIRGAVRVLPAQKVQIQVAPAAPAPPPVAPLPPKAKEPEPPKKD